MTFVVHHQPMFVPSKTNRLRIIKRANVDKNIPIPELSIPGIQNISQSNGNLRKFLWILALVFCLCIALVQIRERVNHYVNGAIAVRVSVAQDEKLNLPYISFCPIGFWKQNIAIQTLMRDYEEKFNEPIVDPLKLLRLNNVNITHLWSLTQLNLSGILITSWNSSINESLEKSFFPSFNGQCVTYHTPKKFPSFLLPEITIELTATGWNFTTPGEHAYKLIIHDNPHLTLYDVGATGITTLYIFRTVLKSTFTKFLFLNTYKSPCTSDTKILRDCRTRCIDQKLQKRIKTKLPYHTISNLPFCSNSTQCAESGAATLKFFSTFNYDQCNCPRLCHGYASHISKFIGAMGTQKISFVRIYMLLDDTIIDKIEEYSAYTSVSLLCDVGAILGLMLGTCILTFIQLCEVFVFFIQRSLKKQNTITHVKPIKQ